MKTNKNTRKIKLAAIAVLIGLGFAAYATEGIGSDKAIKSNLKKTTLIGKKSKIASTSYTFDVSADQQQDIQFTLSVNGTQIGGIYEVSSSKPTAVVLDNNSVSSGATVEVQIDNTFNQPVPKCSYLVGPFTVKGTIAYNLIRFTNVPLTTGGSCNLLFNSSPCN